MSCTRLFYTRLRTVQNVREKINVKPVSLKYTCICSFSRHVGENFATGQKSLASRQQVQTVIRRTKFTFGYKETEPDPFSKTYKDGVGKDFHLIYALPNYDNAHRLILAMCVGCPLFFVLGMSYFYHKTYKELEYTSSDVHEVLENLEEIFVNFPHSLYWLVFLTFLTLCGKAVHYYVARNNICRLYYSPKQDHYIGIVFKNGQKKKLKFSRSEVTRNPAFFENYFAKTGIDVGKKTTYFIFEDFFKDDYRNLFFSEFASSRYLKELKKDNDKRS